MAIFDFVNNFLVKQEGKKEYGKKLKLFLSDANLSSSEQAELEKIATEYNLSKEDLLNLQRSGFKTAYDATVQDKRISEDETKSLEKILEYFGLEKRDVNFDQAGFNKYYSLALIEKGILPEISEGNRGISTIFKKDEKVHCVVVAALRKMKKVTTRLNYSGPVGSIRIMKGLRYRVGSYKISTESKDVLAIEDNGMLYLTSENIGFTGSKKQFSLPYKKIQSLELRTDGLYIFKGGKELPYIVTLNDYEVPMAILSSILNS
jgi:hypothetical protein